MNSDIVLYIYTLYEEICFYSQIQFAFLQYRQALLDNPFFMETFMQKSFFLSRKRNFLPPILHFQPFGLNQVEHAITF